MVECKGLTSILSEAVLKELPTNNTYSVIKYQYDKFGQLIEKTDALGKKESYQYDHVGRLIKTVDRSNVVHEVKG